MKVCCNCGVHLGDGVVDKSPVVLEIGTATKKGGQ